MDSSDQFYSAILDHYNHLAGEKVPIQFITSLSEMLTDHLYEFYADCYVKYPKSAKRYSSLKIDDLDNPLVQDRIINFLKNNGDEQLEYGPVLLNVSPEKFSAIVKNISDFNKIW